MTKLMDDGKRIRSRPTDKGMPVVEIGRADGLVLRVAGQGIFEVHTLPADKELIIGRTEDADICIDDVRLSRRHARLCTGPPLSIEDLNSANGTQVGARTLIPGEVVEFSPGEVLTLGSVMLVVQRGFGSAPPDAQADRPPSVPRGGADVARAPSVVIRAPAMRQLYELVDRVAASSISVLLLGETGVGKEVMADAIHRRSPRVSKPFLQLNCGAMSETLMESELFGHEKGAFTGAFQAKPGLIETADGGTVFLDELGELPPSLQVKLLRVLEERRVTRVGGLRPRAIDVRFVSATNRNLEYEVERNAFRRDLFFRLNGISLTIPPLREREEEIEELARAFVVHAAAKLGRLTPPRLTPDAVERLKAHRWPGNIRELKNVAERAALLCAGDTIAPEDLLLEGSTTTTRFARPTPLLPRETAPEGMSRHQEYEDSAADALPLSQSPATLRNDLELVERRRIMKALDQCAGNQTQAARLLGISRGTLVSRLEQYGVPRPRSRKGP
jgi:two-component system, NtrC family, response regulator AtoC